MRKLLFVLSILFSIAGIIGGCYVICTGGQASPGYAIIPMLFGLSCLQGYRAMKNKKGVQQ